MELKRRKKNNVKSLPLANIRTHDGIEIKQIELELAQYPPIVDFLVFSPAGLLTGIERDPTGGLESFRLSKVLFPLPRKYNYKSFETRHPHNFTAFALTLAKIAYCFATAELGGSGFGENGIRDLINGKRFDAFNFVDGLLTEIYATNNQLHILTIQQRGKYLTVIIHLFASFDGESYEVVVGNVI